MWMHTSCSPSSYGVCYCGCRDSIAAALRTVAASPTTFTADGFTRRLTQTFSDTTP